MANRVFVNKDGFIEQIYEGKQTFVSVVETAAKVMILVDELKKKKKTVRVLVNIEKVTSVSADSLLAAADALNTKPKSKTALFGGRKFLHKLANLVILATRRQKTVRLFKTRLQAEKWLKAK